MNLHTINTRNTNPNDILILEYINTRFPGIPWRVTNGNVENYIPREIPGGEGFWESNNLPDDLPNAIRHQNEGRWW